MNSKELKELISEGNYLIAANSFNGIVEENSTLKNEIVLLCSQLNNWETKNNLGIQEEKTERNRIVLSVLNLIDKHFQSLNKTYDWNTKKLSRNLKRAFERQSKSDLVNLIQKNTFLLSELYTRHWGIHPPFHDMIINSIHIDFVWLNDNSSGPEWVLTKILTPNINVINENKELIQEAKSAINDFEIIMNDIEQKGIKLNTKLGAVAKFRYLIIAGSEDFWNIDSNALWKEKYNIEHRIKIRSQGIFRRSLEKFISDRGHFWSFEENPCSLSEELLIEYWETETYIVDWIERYTGQYYNEN